MQVTRPEQRIALTVAGSDPAGGAGVQGDLRTFAALDVHGLSAITAIIAQGTRGVRAVWPVDAAQVRAQIEVVLEDVTAHVAKTGALATAAIVREVALAFEARPALPLIVDPIIVSSSGARLLDEEGIALLLERLMPLATLITPNAPELARLLGDERGEAPTSVDALARGAERLVARGARAVLAKGGHLDGDPIDVLVASGTMRMLPGARIDTTCTRGTGCVLSSAIAAHLARGSTLGDAVVEGRAFLRAAMSAARPIGEGASPLDPFFARRPSP